MYTPDSEIQSNFRDLPTAPTFVWASACRVEGDSEACGHQPRSLEMG